MSYRCAVRFSKLKRLLTSVPIADFLASVMVVVAILTIGASIVGGNLNADTKRYLLISETVAVIAAPFLIGILASKTWLEYQRRRHDPSLIFTFQKEFDSLEDTKRKEAAVVCMAFLNRNDEADEVKRWARVGAREREKVEPVLDFFEDLGFYLHGDQFSDDVAHHHFFHWIRGWYSVLESYVKYYQDEGGEKAAYVHVERLHGRTAEIEKMYERPEVWLTEPEEKLEFLKAEAGERASA